MPDTVDGVWCTAMTPDRDRYFAGMAICARAQCDQMGSSAALSSAGCALMKAAEDAQS